VSPHPSPLPGIYGKIPSNGDFVTRRLPAAFVAPWDLWLQDAMAESREQLGPHWLDIYLTSPIWRFALSPGVAGPGSWAGVVMPSVDRVGRYYPLTLACSLHPEANPVRVVAKRAAWFASAELLALSCLRDDFDLEAFDRKVQALGAPGEPESYRDAESTRQGLSPALRLPMAEEADLGGAFDDLLDQALGELFFGFSLWRTQGSDRVEPSLLLCQGLPPRRGFAALLDGGWSRWGWRERPAPGDDAAPTVPTTP
jgi:type VI secretion system protein ImpM